MPIKVSSLKELRSYLDIASVVEYLHEGKPARRVFGSKLLHCPLHEDDTPSLYVYDAKDGQRFKCFGASCGKSGDALALIQFAKDHPTIEQTLEYLMQHKDVLPDLDLDLTELVKENIKEKEILDFWNNIWDACKRELASDTDAAGRAREWLTGRGLSERALSGLPIGLFDYKVIAAKFGQDNLKMHQIESTWLATTPCVAFAYYSDLGTLSRIKCREIGGEARYARFIGTELGEDIGFFGLNLLDNETHEDVLLVEGEFDCAIFHSYDFVENGQFANVLCRSGAALKAPGTFETLKNLGTKKIIIFPDSDDGGVGLVRDLARVHLGGSVRIDVAWPSDYTSLVEMRNKSGVSKADPHEYVRCHANFSEVVSKIANSTVPIPRFLASMALEAYERKVTKTDEDFLKLREDIVTSASEGNLTGFALDDYIDYIVDKVPSISKDSLRFEVSKSKRHSAAKVAVIGQNVFLKRADGYYLRTIDRKTKQPADVRIINCLIEYDKVIRFLDEGAKPSYEARLVLNHKEYKITISSDDLVDFKTFRDMIERLAPSQLVFDPMIEKHFRSLINAFNEGVSEADGFNTVGMIGKKFIYPAFYVENGTVCQNTKYHVKAPGQMASLYDIPLIEDKKQLEECRDLLTTTFIKTYRDPMLTYSLLGHIMVSPLVDILRLKPWILYVEGRFSSGKTTISQLAMNTFCRYPVRGSNISSGDTINFVVKSFSHMAGVPIFWDDIKASVMRDITTFTRVINNYHDRSGRGRLDRTAAMKTQDIIKGNLLMCGENLPTDESSVLSRMIILRMAHDLYNDAAVEELIPNVEKLSALTPHYIAWLQKQNVRLVNVADEHKKHRCGIFLNGIGTGLFCFLKFLVEEHGLPSSEMDRHWSYFIQHVPELLKANFESTYEESEERLFMRIVEQLIHSGSCTLVDDSSNAVKVGYIQGESVYLFSDIALKEVEKVTKRILNRKSLFQSLKEGGYIKAVSLKKGVASSKTGSTWCFNRDKFFENIGEPARIHVYDSSPVEM